FHFRGAAKHPETSALRQFGKRSECVFARRAPAVPAAEAGRRSGPTARTHLYGRALSSRSDELAEARGAACGAGAAAACRLLPAQQIQCGSAPDEGGSNGGERLERQRRGK